MTDSVWPTGRVTAVRPTGHDASEAGPWTLERGALALVVVLDDVPVGDLPAGTRLRLGPTAVVELVAGGDNGDRVASVSSHIGGLLEASARILVPAEVLGPGEVAPGDAVTLEAVALPLTDVLDLHSFRPEETQEVLTAYLAGARHAGLDEVRIVHGRGRGVQRALVRQVLGGAPEVAGFADAPPARGGWGATVVRLRRAEDSTSR